MRVRKKDENCQRLAIARADRILVLENGRIVEQGRHAELMQASGRYRQMVDLQTSPPPPTPRVAASSMVESVPQEVMA